MNRVERFKKQKHIQEKIKHRKGLALVADQNLVRNFLNSEVNYNAIQASTERLNSVYDFQPDLEVSSQEVSDLLQFLENDFNDKHFNDLVAACKSDVLSAIVVPFGLGKIVGKFDKNGGNVDTIHNVREGVYATEHEKNKYENKSEYESKNYHAHKDYIETNRQHKKQQEAGFLTDSYTGEKISRHNKRDLDHTIAAKEIHEDRGRILADVNGSSLANKASNLHSTDSSINRSKKAETVEQFVAKLENNRPQREIIIKELSQKENLTDKERSRLNKLENLEKVDSKKIKEVDDKARKEYNGTLNQEYYTSEKFKKNVAITGVKESAKAGGQQALGLVVYEFFDAVFDELHDIYKNGFSTNSSDDRFLHVLEERLSRIANRIASRWKDVGAAFANGFISGFLSHLVTVAFNMFVRTGKRMVRIIREGFFSLMKAIKMICFPPEGMTVAQAAHEASKLIAAGLVVTGGIAIEQSIDAMIKTMPMLEPFADILTSILIGGLTGLATTLIVYAIDKIDFFKVNDDEKHIFVMNKLETSLENMFAEGDILIAKMAF